MISVIIPTRNRYPYVKLLIQDVLKQKNNMAYELIVVDQSTNPEKLEDCVHIITDTTGPCYSRNLAVKNATGHILVFLDDDARIESNFLEEITNPIFKRKYSAVSGAVCDPEGNYLKTEKDYLTQENTNFIKILTANPNHNKSRVGLCLPAGCCAIVKDVFIELGGFDETFDPTGAGEDRELSIRLFKAGYPIWYNANAKLLHAIAAKGGSRDIDSRSMMLDVHSYRICKKHFSITLANELRDTILKSYKKRFYDSILSFKLVKTRYHMYQKIKRLMD
ncbi:glycosyltransferase family 2 protein [Winogradskyella undariae]|uniref:glycosyltransferase family 2 protein n=1 Tax=Winogradskyella undariae TaxID=1285465 RepID=UPI0015CAF1C8|nr:glycosyltransferase [Winogradskyella undariae]